MAGSGRQDSGSRFLSIIGKRLPESFLLAALLFSACGKSEAPAPAADKPAPQATHDAHAGPPQTLGDWARGAKLFDGLGSFHRAITTASPDAQKYFDQGMRLLWAFNHDESTRSFAKAAELDPSCAFCYWGVALTVGPNYNLPIMAEPRAKVAWESLQKAQQLAPKSTPVEQALIGALGNRYHGPQPLDPSNTGPVLTAYASAMRQVARTYPGDLDVQVLFAESLMNINPWKLWTLDGKPAPGTEEAAATLERVLAKEPTHPGANHYYVHVMEASPRPASALASAERLHDMMPAAGHLQHMPAHIMQRVGRYEDAARANRDGLAADVAYMSATPPLDYYGMYLAHNYQFLAYSAAMEGRKTEALDAARRMKDSMPVEMLLMMPGADWSVSEVYSVMLRFGMWDEMIAEPAPDARLKALTAAYHYARSVAFSAKNRVDDAKAALAELEKFAKEAPPDAGAGLNTLSDVLAVAVLAAKGHLAAAQGHMDEAADRFREAGAKEDRLAYDEPADWFIPVRHDLGDVLLRMKKPAEAEWVYRDDLKQHPNNGWALMGLAQAMTAQKNTADAAKLQQLFKDAWAHADVTVTGSVVR